MIRLALSLACLGALKAARVVGVRLPLFADLPSGAEVRAALAGVDLEAVRAEARAAEREVLRDKHRQLDWLLEREYQRGLDAAAEGGAR